jgi:CRP/FNR family transcriptional regulator, cyclic AMP receptor protein
MTTLVERLRKADELIESLAFLDVAERLVRTLLEAAADDSTSTTGFRKAGRLTHKELAARIGSSREAVSKCLKVLSGKSIVKESDGDILIVRYAQERLKHNERT